MKFSVWHLNKRLLVILIRIKFRNKSKYQFKLDVKGSLLEYHELNAPSGSVNTIYYYYPLRTTRYFMGIQDRLNHIGKEYCLDQINHFDEGVIVDIGSNVGEFTLRAHQIFPSAQFVRFEPSKTENMASILNLNGINQTLIEKPLWNSVTKLKFYNENETGDSSLFKPNAKSNSIEVETSTLDVEISKLNIKKIQLLKLEAEGAEPEILEGGSETLKITQNVTADLGPERGMNQDRTFDQVNELLLRAGFSLQGRNPGNRECYLYSRSST